MSLLSNSLSENTSTSYRHAFRLYDDFICSNPVVAKGSVSLPPSVQNLSMFIAYCFNKGLASATVISYMSALSFIFKLGNYPDVPQHFIIRKMLQGFKKLRSTSDSRLPITPSILNDLVNSLSHTVSVHFHRILFKAMYLLAFHAFLRIGELTSSGTSKHFLLREHVIVEKDGIQIVFHHFKHSTGQPVRLLISVQENIHLCPVTALSEYLSLRQHGKQDEPLFSFMNGSPISRSFFNSNLQRSLGWAGLSLSAYKSHSFRIGAATTAALKGYSEADIQYMGRWKSDAFKKYIRIPSLRI